ncbi:uncharacterized protein LOC143033726 [Oratosquilla oratoria]|uniref:uncharacterized protein LOC143033726 n=1 Tax=Oratosquilla oratoria TaxID=337810 RepID=UPI003F769572
MIQGMEVPRLSVKGGTANLSCWFELQGRGLYSLKWYHNQTEFYRYVPTETRRPVHMKAPDAFTVHELSRSGRHVALALEGLRTDASGEYKCEVIAEHPSFRTEASKGELIVLEQPLSPPLIMGVRAVYQPHDLISVRCEARPLILPDVIPLLAWFIQGRPVHPDLTSSYHRSYYNDVVGTKLLFPAHQMTSPSSTSVVTVEVECRLSLGPLTSRTLRRFRVAPLHSTSLLSYHSCSEVPKNIVPAVIILTAQIYIRFFENC